MLAIGNYFRFIDLTKEGDRVYILGEVQDITRQRNNEYKKGQNEKKEFSSQKK